MAAKHENGDAPGIAHLTVVPTNAGEEGHSPTRDLDAEDA